MSNPAIRPAIIAAVSNPSTPLYLVRAAVEAVEAQSASGKGKSRVEAIEAVEAQPAIESPFALIKDGETTPIAVTDLHMLFATATAARLTYQFPPADDIKVSVEWALRQARQGTEQYARRPGFGAQAVITTENGDIALPLTRLFQLWAAQQRAADGKAVARAAVVSDRVPATLGGLPNPERMLKVGELRGLAEKANNGKNVGKFSVVAYLGFNRKMNVEARAVAVRDENGEPTEATRVQVASQVPAYSPEYVLGSTFEHVDAKVAEGALPQRFSNAGIVIGVVPEGSEDILWVAFYSASFLVQELTGFLPKLPFVQPSNRRGHVSKDVLAALALEVD